mgnify:FL=1
MKHLPIFLDIQNKSCLVVGGGEVAARKVALLHQAGGQVTVVAPAICEAISRIASEGNVEQLHEPFSNSHVDGRVAVIAATSDQEVNTQVAMAARRLNIPCNVVDRPDIGNFTMPSIINRDPVIIAISTGGSSPVLARLLRSRLETLIPAAYGRLASLIVRYRNEVKQQFGSTAQRRRFWERTLQGPVAEIFFSGREKEAAEALKEAISDTDNQDLQRGEVYLVGAGPGDPDLLTFRAMRLIQQADVVLYDRLVSKEVLALTRRDSEKIYVGKEKSNHAIPQQEINTKLVELAREGKRVLRLKGGDPFIFGRGGEEIDQLSGELVPFQVVPGITAAAGCAAYSGIPLTHRDYAQSCVFVTGHLKDGSIDLNWELLTQPDQTVVVYMGLTGIETLCRQLIHHGTSESMPAALVQQGTTPHQRVITGTVKTLPEIVKQERVKPPTLIIIGEVVTLREKLSWFNPDIGSSDQP